jgi:integrase
MCRTSVVGSQGVLASSGALPIPPELVQLLHDHIERFGTAPDGRLFRSERGGVIQPSTWWQVWRKVRNLSLTPEQLATPLMERPYDLRHAGITWRLNSGVPAPDVAKWAGHSVEVLTRIYAGCVVGLDEVWIARMSAGLRPGGLLGGEEHNKPGQPGGDDSGGAR